MEIDMIKKLTITTFLLLSSSIEMVNANDYCLAVRGNGELIAAHWGAISKLVQEKGMPKAMAGGSSASITIFLLESLAQNKLFVKNEEKSFLIKSFQGYFQSLAKTKEGVAIKGLLKDKDIYSRLYQEMKEHKGNRIDEKTLSKLKKSLGRIYRILSSDDLIDIINTEFLSYVMGTIEMMESSQDALTEELLSKINFRKNEISMAIDNFGKFNAETDETLFFRPGLFSFNKLAEFIGRMGDFYAGMNSSTNMQLANLVSKCSLQSEALTWSEIVALKPSCQSSLSKLALSFIQSEKQKSNRSVRLNSLVGSSMDVFPTTAILSGKAVDDYRKFKLDYMNDKNVKYSEAFRVDPSDLSFGYWGKVESLERIKVNLAASKATKNDEKSKKFLGLGMTKWQEVLVTSPAEPGLSNLVPLAANNKLSAGGWSDLHPTLILKAHGCHNVVYVTREGGETLFGQGAVKKLINIDGFNWEDWRNLTKEERRRKNAEGNPHDVGSEATLWGKLYNMGNPESSIRKSMIEASTVICTRWDSFNVSTDLDALVADAFRAPWIDDKNEVCRPGR